MIPTDPPPDPGTRSTSARIGPVLLAGLVLASVWLGVNRIFQVDEVLYAALAKFMASGRMAYVPNVPLILLGPLTWLAGAAHDSMDVLIYLRMPFVALFWANAILVVKGGGLKLRSREGLYALLLVATLAPMWDYGFEIRHDVPLLTMTLVLWWLVRARRPAPPVRLFLAGVAAGLMELIAFKGFIFAVPMVALGLYLAHPERVRRGLAYLGLAILGAALALAMGRAAHGLAGTWSLAWSGFQDTSRFAASTVTRFSPWNTLARAVTEAPLAFCGGLAVLAVPFVPARGWQRRDLLDLPWFPEWCFAAICLVLFFANPTPFPYNLIHLFPAFLVLLLQLREPLRQGLAALAPAPRKALVGALLLLHILPWTLATSRHFAMDNERQGVVIALAEAMTDPAQHGVFDGSGLVSCRNPPGPHWLLHTFTIAHFRDGSWPSLRSLLARNPTPVILPNYRTEWLPAEDQTFIRTHYLPLAEDICVLGTLLGAGAASWEALAQGRYQLDFSTPTTASQGRFEVDGKPVEPGIVTLTKGDHTFKVPEGRQLRVAWLGPRLQGLPPLGPASRPLFVNWY